jgi:hypothetical protein
MALAVCADAGSAPATMARTMTANTRTLFMINPIPKQLEAGPGLHAKIAVHENEPGIDT